MRLADENPFGYSLVKDDTEGMSVLKLIAHFLGLNNNMWWGEFEENLRFTFCPMGCRFMFLGKFRVHSVYMTEYNGQNV